jgi:hypothetical protein
MVRFDFHKDLQHKVEVNFHLSYTKTVLESSVNFATECAFSVLSIMTIV